MSDQMNQQNPNDELGIGLKIVSFLIPLVGAILYFVNKKDNPGKAKAACNFALYGIVFGIIIQVIMTLVAGSM